MCIALFSDIHGNIQALDVAVASYHLAHRCVDYDRDEVIREMAHVHTRRRRRQQVSARPTPGDEKRRPAHRPTDTKDRKSKGELKDYAHDQH